MVVLDGDLVFYGVCAVSAVVACLLSCYARGITYFGADTDNMKQVKTAAAIGKWRWPSHMHTVVEGGTRTRMKDSVILGLVVMQRMLRDKISDYPLVVLCVIANAISSVLVFKVAEAYWGTGVGLFVWAFYFNFIASYELVLFGAAICIAQTYFLLTLFLIQQASNGALASTWAFFLLAGVTAGLMLFGSASSRKYTSLVVAGFFYSQYSYLTSFVARFSESGLTYGMIDLRLLSLAALVAGCWIVIRLGYKGFITSLYFGRFPGKLANGFIFKNEHSLEHYLGRAKEYSNDILKVCTVLCLYFLLCAIVAPPTGFYATNILFLGGVCVLVALLNYPNLLRNLNSYYGHSQGWKYNRFSLYEDLFSKLGKSFNGFMRGGGVEWIFRYYWRIAPLFCIELVIASIFLAYGIWNSRSPFLIIEALGVVSLGLLPIIIAEWGNCAQQSRTYYPVFNGLLFIVGYEIYVIKSTVDEPVFIVFAVLSALVAVAGISWTAWIFATDVWPARMAPARLGLKLKALGAKEFYTYDTPYNDAFVNALYETPSRNGNRPEVRYIKSLKEVGDGYIVVPGTSSKAFNMESTESAFKGADFNADPELKALMESESKLIEKCSVASFKTFGTSKMWVHQSEVMTYRDLILNDISDYDRWRGYAWIIDARKVPVAVGAR